MQKAILGKKIGMTQVFAATGEVVPVTVIEAGPCVVTQVKTKETDGYEAIQVAFLPVKENALNKPKKGHFARAGVKPHRFLREFRLESIAEYKTGQVVLATIFAPGEAVDVTGISKGRGFAGVIQRWGFSRGPMTHGSKYHRGVGSLSSRAGARTFPGRKLPGQYGRARRTVQNLQVVRVDLERNLMLVKGSVPGPKGCLVTIKNSVKA
ncbi:MAG: 50S ribosomal protein L3 [Firmicutes bacterium]|nr:50S ribosomal protein L3 [Bacillota bacterium]MBT9151966.1 50S ribosomal protein L3 [Bacillota bacterium]MBT9157475.1 50S ribosomal protein L3 [Bacillota bacterium]